MSARNPQTRRNPYTLIAVAAVGLAALAAAANVALADDWAAGPSAAAGEELRVTELEKAFWYCDYVASTEGIQATPMAACRFATEELKKQKFGGSFSQMLEWWRANKPAEHGRLALLEDR